MTARKTAEVPKIDKDLLNRLARTVRGLVIDATNDANSGHPGMPLGCADFAVLLWYYHMSFNPGDPAWKNRDRFVLSAGHGSMLLYSMLHLTGYDLPIDEIKKFRQLHSRTPGHPENYMTAGVETTTGPLGQGFSNGVGMALATHMMHERFPELVDHNIYGIVSDGDLMEGISGEASSFAGHHKLGRLIYFYDDNQISIDGSTDITFSGEDVAKRYEAYGWHVQKVDGHNLDEMNEALAKAKAETERPSIIVGRTHIGYGSPKQDTAGAHGSPLGEEAGNETKKFLGLDPGKKYDVPDEDYAAWRRVANDHEADAADWARKLESLDSKKRDAFLAFYEQPLPDLKQWRPEPVGKAIATRKSAGLAENAYAPHLPWLVGGSADLAASNNNTIKGAEHIAAGKFGGRNIHFGVREHNMCGMLNGMALYGTFRPFGATFLVFSDYARPSIRLACLIKLPTIYLFTHDSVFLGEDGPTHQPVEHLAALRAIPHMTLMRPGDDEEAFAAWEFALEHREAPVALILTRQNLPDLKRKESGLAEPDGLKKGGYVLRDCEGEPDLILMASGSELHLIVQAAEELAKNHKVRVVSMPSPEQFRRQDQKYKDSVLPPSCRRRLVVEAGTRFGWQDLATEDGAYITQEEFGESAPWEDIAREKGFTTENVVKVAKDLAKK